METKNTDNKHSRFCYKSILEIKENLDDIIVKGYIATTHFDGEDIIKKETLEKWAEEINSGNPRSNKVSVHHNREPHVAGVGIQGTAKVDQLPDGQYGLYVETLVNKTREDFGEIKYQVENNIIDSFSIEYIANPNAQFDNGARILDVDTELFGWTLASQPMNEHAVMIKELFKINKVEVKTMTEEVKDNIPKVEVKEIEKVVEPSDYQELKQFKEKHDVEAKKAEDTKKMDEIKEQIKKELSEKIADLDKKIESKVQVNTDKPKMEVKELMEFKEIIKPDTKYDKYTMFKVAGKIANMTGLAHKGGVKASVKSAEEKAESFDTIQSKEVGQCGKYLMEFKSLGVTTNQNTDTDYLLSAAELSDVFDPVIRNVLNQETVTWNLLPKEDYSMKGNNLVQFTMKTVANTTAAAYLNNAINTGNVTRLKYQTKFKKYAVGVEVDGDMIAAARGGAIGDVFAKEVADSTEDLLAVINVALFAEVGAETASGVIGFEYICDQAGNTTLYNLTRSQANGLSSTTTADNYINGSSADISLTNLRAAKRKALKEGAKIENLVFITDHIQGDKFRGIYDAIQRTVPTSSRFGFEGRPSFDGIPIFEDKDCNDDDWWLIDLDTYRVAVWVAPTLEMLGKDADSQKGFIKTYFATYCTAPRRQVMIYGNATT